MCMPPSTDRVAPVTNELSAHARYRTERAISSGQAVELDPMTAVERKTVHLRLKEFPGVTTRSEGTEPNRYVVIEPA